MGQLINLIISWKQEFNAQRVLGSLYQNANIYQDILINKIIQLSMDNLKCQIKDHYGTQIIVACMDKYCKRNKLCCWKCVAEFHGSHQTNCVEISQINEFIQQERNKQANQSESCSYGQKQIILNLERIIKLIENYKKIVIEKINDLQKILFERIERINTIIMEKTKKIKSQNLQEYLKKTNNSQSGIEYWNQYLGGILQYVEVDKSVINLIKFKEGQLNERDEQEMKFIQQSAENIQTMINKITKIYIKIENPAKMIGSSLFFDANRKNGGFEIIGKSTIKMTQFQPYAMAFANHGFNPQDQSYSFAFNIQNIVSFILVGVGNDERIKESSYINKQLENIAHGQYLINSYFKYTCHDSNWNFQNQTEGIEFKSGDKIQIKYDHITKILEFRRQSDQVNYKYIKKNVVKMPITDMTKILYPCVMCHDKGNQAQIVEY